MTIVVAVCAVVGAIAGIAGSAAAPSSSKPKSSAQAPKKAAKRALKRAFRVGPGPFGFGGGPVHATAVVPNRDGSGFLTITTDAGTLNSVDGTTLHIKEGIDKAVYKDDAAVDVGSDAKVFRNRAEAKLSDLKDGDHVRVITGGPKGSVVVAEDDAFLAQQKQRFERRAKQFKRRGFMHPRFAPGGFAPGGPPPAAGGPPPGAPGING